MKVFNLLTACAIAAPLLFVSCNSDDALNTPDREADGTRITFTLGVSAGPADLLSRGTSLSDDGGNYDIGLDGEREVNDAMIVIYDRPINSDLSKESGDVVKVFFIDHPSPFNATTDKTSPYYFDPLPSYYPQTDVLNKIEVGKTVLSDACQMTMTIMDDSPLEPGKRYYALALCNFGDKSKDIEKMTLKDFRDHVYNGALYDKTSGNIKGYKNFRMSGINEVSFIWERKAQGNLDMGQFLVQRMAARVDVTFGNPQQEFINQSSYIGDQFMRLAVYTQNNDGIFVIKTDESVRTEKDAGGKDYGMPLYSFYLTDLKLYRVVNNGMYLIERSSPHSPSWRDDDNKPAQPVYLDNEGWSSFTSGSRKATKYIFCPSGKSYSGEMSLADEAGYNNLCELIKGGVFFNDTGVNYYENKKKSSVVGYMPENTCSENNYTILRIEGYTDAATSAIFTGSRALDTTGKTKVIGDIPIMHNTDANSHVMDYAVVRNTIYRLRIKVLATENKIYFRYYYCMPGETSQREYDVTAFLKDVADNKTENPTIND